MNQQGAGYNLNPTSKQGAVVLFQASHRHALGSQARGVQAVDLRLTESFRSSLRCQAGSDEF